MRGYIGIIVETRARVQCLIPTDFERPGGVWAWERGRKTRRLQLILAEVDGHKILEDGCLDRLQTVHLKLHLMELFLKGEVLARG